MNSMKPVAIKPKSMTVTNSPSQPLNLQPSFTPMAKHAVDTSKQKPLKKIIKSKPKKNAHASPASQTVVESPSINSSSFILDPLVLPPPALESESLYSNSNPTQYNQASAPTSSSGRQPSTSSTLHLNTPHFGGTPMLASAPGTQLSDMSPPIQPVKLPPPPHRKRTIIQVTPNIDHSSSSSKAAKANSPSGANAPQKRQRRNSSLVSVDSIGSTPFTSPSLSPKSSIAAPGSARIRVTSGGIAASDLKDAAANSPSTIAMTPPTPPLLSDNDQRKHARRTAHSEIERRRRSKMNQEFESLKQLVPACQQSISSSGATNGLHKLVILQETVEYVRYLKNCLEAVETQNKEMQLHMIQQQQQVSNAMANSSSSSSSGSSSGSMSGQNQNARPEYSTNTSVAASPALDPSTDRDLASGEPANLYPNLHPHLQQLQQQQLLQQQQEEMQQQQSQCSSRSNTGPQAQSQHYLDHDETTAAAAAALVGLDKSSRKASFSHGVSRIASSSSSSSSTRSPTVSPSQEVKELKDASTKDGKGYSTDPVIHGAGAVTEALSEKTTGSTHVSQLPVAESESKCKSPVAPKGAAVLSPQDARGDSEDARRVEPSPRIRVSDLIC